MTLLLSALKYWKVLLISGLLILLGAAVLDLRAVRAEAETARTAFASSETNRKKEQAAHALAVEALTDRAAAAEAAYVRINPTRVEVRRVPSTTACSTSPAIRALINGVRKPQAGGGAAQRPAPRKPAAVQR